MLGAQEKLDESHKEHILGSLPSDESTKVKFESLLLDMSLLKGSCKEQWVTSHSLNVCPGNKIITSYGKYTRGYVAHTLLPMY